MPVSLRVQMLSGVLSKTAPTILIFAPCAARFVIPLVERDPVRGVVADGEPVQGEDQLLRRLRDGRARHGQDVHGREHGGEALHGDLLT